MRLTLLLLLLPGLWWLIPSQAAGQDKTLWGMDVHPYSQSVNPAIAYNQSVIIIGPRLQFSAGNSSLTFNSVFQQGKGAQDTILYLDSENLARRIRTRNQVSAGGNATFLYAGKLFDGGKYLSFAIARRIDVSLSFPGNIADLRFGNVDNVTQRPRTMMVNDLLLNGACFTEFRFGWSWPWSEKLRTGVHLKLLVGQAGAETTRLKASLATRDDFSVSVLNTDAAVNLSAPVLIRNEETESVSVDREIVSRQLKWPGWPSGNPGVAIDAGFKYQINPKTILSGSVNDVGVIRWAASPQQLRAGGSYEFAGLQFTSEDIRNLDIEEKVREITDTLQALFYPDVERKPFSTRLIARSYLGLQMIRSEKLSYHTLLKMTRFYDAVYADLTAGVAYRPVRRLQLSGSWSLSNRSLYNFGLGVAFTGPRYQVYAVTRPPQCY